MLSWLGSTSMLLLSVAFCSLLCLRVSGLVTRRFASDLLYSEKATTWLMVASSWVYLVSLLFFFLIVGSMVSLFNLSTGRYVSKLWPRGDPVFDFCSWLDTGNPSFFDSVPTLHLLSVLIVCAPCEQGFLVGSRPIKTSPPAISQLLLCGCRCKAGVQLWLQRLLWLVRPGRVFPCTSCLASVDNSESWSQASASRLKSTFWLL